MVVRAEGLNPGHILDELHLIGRIAIEPEPQRQRQDEPGKNHEVRPCPDQSFVLLRKEEENNHARQRPERHDGQDMLTKEVHYGVPHKTQPIKIKTPKIMTSA